MDYQIAKRQDTKHFRERVVTKTPQFLKCAQDSSVPRSGLQFQDFFSPPSTMRSNLLTEQYPRTGVIPTSLSAEQWPRSKLELHFSAMKLVSTQQDGLVRLSPSRSTREAAATFQVEKADMQVLGTWEKKNTHTQTQH